MLNKSLLVTINETIVTKTKCMSVLVQCYQTNKYSIELNNNSYNIHLMNKKKNECMYEKERMEL